MRWFNFFLALMFVGFEPFGGGGGRPCEDIDM